MPETRRRTTWPIALTFSSRRCRRQNKSIDLTVRIAVVASTIVWLSVSSLFAQENGSIKSDDDPEPSTVFVRHGTDRIWLSGQVNVIFQTHGPFPADYSGEHSFRPTFE